MTTEPVTWALLSDEVFDRFIARGRMEKDEKDLHKDGRKLLFDVVRRIRKRQTHFIINISKQMIKDSPLNILSYDRSDRTVFEFCMLHGSKSKRSYVGKQFILVRSWKDRTKVERQRIIYDEYRVSLPDPILAIVFTLSPMVESIA